MSIMRIDVYSHNVVISQFTREVRDTIANYMSSYVEYDVSKNHRGDIIRKAVRVYGGATFDRSEYRIHRSALDEFLNHLSNFGYPKTSIDITYHPLPFIEPIEVNLLENVKPRPAQIPLIEHLIKPIPSKLAVLQMGGGKTFSLLYAISVLKQRFVIVLKPMYIDRWVKALTDPKERILDIEKKDILTVQGTKELKRLIDYAKADALSAKIIIVSNRTLYGMYEHYERTGDLTFYGIHPNDFYPLLKANRAIDELHQEFHFNFRQDMYTHTGTCIGLSGTMTSDTPFINRMYRYMFPKDAWYEDTNYNRYTNVISLYYNLRNEQDIKYIRRGRASYSHIDFEKSIMKSKTTCKNYIDMMLATIDEYYIREYQEGQRCIVFAGMVDMCQLIVTRLRERYPHLTINKYTSGDPYSNLLTSDISVSTIGSAGTAVDIPDLMLCLSTTAISKSETNLQVMGRLRENKRWPNKHPVFAYFVCEDIPKHVSYHTKKVKLLKPYVLGQKTVFTDVRI